MYLYSRFSQGNIDNVTDEEVDEFVSEDVVTKKILRRQLAAVDDNKLRKNNSLEKLIKLARESFKAHWKEKDIHAIKSLDRITQNIVIPS